MKKIKIIECSIFIGFLIAIVLSVTSFAETCDEIRTDVLRLHVIANSDSPEDQALKLKVRDAILEKGENMFLLDFPAGHERLNYDKFTKMVQDRSVVVQDLLK